MDDIVARNIDEKGIRETSLVVGTATLVADGSGLDAPSGTDVAS